MLSQATIGTVSRIHDENSRVCQAKFEKRKKSFVFKVKSHRKALSALSSCQLAFRPIAPLHSSKIVTKRPAAAVLKTTASKVIEDDLDHLDFDKLSIGDSIRTASGDSYSSSDEFFELSDDDDDVRLRPSEFASWTNTTYLDFEMSTNLKKPPVAQNIQTSVESGMDWTAHNMAFFHTIQPEFQYEIPDDIEDYDADLEL